MRDDDAVPLAAGDLGGQHLAAIAGQVLLRGHEQLGVGIELHELAGELLEQVVGDDVHRLLDQTGLLHLHAGRGHRERLARTDRMGEERVARTHPTPDGVVLVGPELDRLIHPRKIEVRAVEEAGTQVVVRVVVDPHEPFGAIGFGEHPGAEPFLDELLFLAGGHRRFLVDDPLLAVAMVDRVVDRRGFHVEGEFQEPCAVGALRSELGRGGHGDFRGVIGVEAPDGVFLQVADRHRRWIDLEQVRREGLDVAFGYPGGTEIGVNIAWENVFGLD